MSPAVASTWIDNHCHIPPGDDGDAWVRSAREAGVGELITVGVTLARSREAIEIAARHDNVYATVGVHPHDARDGVAGLAELLASPKVVAVGEAGLDYHYDHSPRDVQRKVFAEHIALAIDSGLPLVIHTREAWDDTFSILDTEGVPPHTVLHCFTGGPAEADRGLERGMMVSVSGIVTFPNAAELREAVSTCPLDRLMVETDSPYLAPVPLRGRRNQPANVVHVGAEVAALQNVPVAVVSATTTASARAFYRLP